MVISPIEKRRSIRHFDDAEVSADLIADILEAARLAPSACNIQPIRVLVLSDPDDLDACRSAAYGIGACMTAPVIMLCMADRSAVDSVGERAAELQEAGAFEPVDLGSLESGIGHPFELRLGEDIMLVSAGVAVEHMVIQAAADGLGTCWVHHFDHDQLRSHFGIPDHLELLTLLPLGWPAESPEPRPRLASIEWNRE
ncbi:MAG: nitroreductase family protein [Coriobacteriia bacterium]